LIGGRDKKRKEGEGKKLEVKTPRGKTRPPSRSCKKKTTPPQTKETEEEKGGGKGGGCERKVEKM